MKKQKKQEEKVIKLYEAIFFGACILILIFLLFRIWW